MIPQASPASTEGQGASTAFSNSVLGLPLHLTALSRFICTSFTTTSILNVIDYDSHQQSNALVDPTTMVNPTPDQIKDITNLPEALALRLVLIENPSPAAVEVLMTSWLAIEPDFFADFLSKDPAPSVNTYGIDEGYPHAFLKTGSVSAHRSFIGVNMRKCYYYVDSDDGGGIRSRFRFDNCLCGYTYDAVLERVSILSRNVENGRIVIILFDRNVKNKTKDKFTDFESGFLFSDPLPLAASVSQTRGYSSGTCREHLLALLSSSRCSDIASKSSIYILYFILQVACAQWLTLMACTHECLLREERYVAQRLSNISDDDALWNIWFSNLTFNLTMAVTLSNRLIIYEQELKIVLTLIRGSPIPQGWLNGWPDVFPHPKALEDDYLHLLDRLRSLRDRTDRLGDNLKLLLTLREAKRTRRSGNTVSRITQLAFIYLPLTFSAGVFGMNVKQLGGPAPLWKFAVTSLGLLLGTLLMSKIMKRFPQIWVQMGS